jgi:hypothetical protein
MNSGSGNMGATPHTTNDSLAWLRARFKDRLISRKCEIEWVAHSPDLNPPYFYLWGYLKDNVYENNPQTIGELKAAITAKIREIPKDECVRVIAFSVRERRFIIESNISRNAIA